MAQVESTLINPGPLHIDVENNGNIAMAGPSNATDNFYSPPFTRKGTLFYISKL